MFRWQCLVAVDPATVRIQEILLQFFYSFWLLTVHPIHNNKAHCNKDTLCLNVTLPANLDSSKRLTIEKLEQLHAFFCSLKNFKLLLKLIGVIESTNLWNKKSAAVSTAVFNLFQWNWLSLVVDCVSLFRMVCLVDCFFILYESLTARHSHIRDVANLQF